MPFPHPKGACIEQSSCFLHWKESMPEDTACHADAEIAATCLSQKADGMESNVNFLTAVAIC